jgi:2-methylisocitrate lyase-like PEP mutase family enzyme
MTQGEKAERFLALHRRGDPLLMPNAWDLGSTAVLGWMGFEALATTRTRGHARAPRRGGHAR